LFRFLVSKPNSSSEIDWAAIVQTYEEQIKLDLNRFTGRVFLDGKVLISNKQWTMFAEELWFSTSAIWLHFFLQKAKNVNSDKEEDQVL